MSLIIMYNVPPIEMRYIIPILCAIYIDIGFRERSMMFHVITFYGLNYKAKKNYIQSKEKEKQWYFYLHLNNDRLMKGSWPSVMSKWVSKTTFTPAPVVYFPVVETSTDRYETRSASSSRHRLVFVYEASMTSGRVCMGRFESLEIVILTL